MTNNNAALRKLSLQDLLTIGLIVISGGGNFLTTFNGNQSRHAEIDKAIAEIHELHGLIDNFSNQHKEILELIKRGAK